MKRFTRELNCASRQSALAQSGGLFAVYAPVNEFYSDTIDIVYNAKSIPAVCRRTPSRPLLLGALFTHIYLVIFSGAWACHSYLDYRVFAPPIANYNRTQVKLFGFGRNSGPHRVEFTHRF